MTTPNFMNKTLPKWWWFTIILKDQESFLVSPLTLWHSGSRVNKTVSAYFLVQLIIVWSMGTRVCMTNIL